MKPVIILPPKAMSAADIGELRANGICVVVCKNPESIRFVEPPPGGYDRMERAAIELFRVVLTNRTTLSRNELLETYCDCLTKGTRLEPTPPAPKATKVPLHK